MASYFNLALDTTAPAGVTLAINSGAAYCTSTAATLAIGCSDTTKTGYQMKIWGVNGAAAEANAAWESYAASKSVTLTSGDGLKTVSVKVRDAVGNESAAVSDTITLDATKPTVTITGPDVSTISKLASYNVCAFSFVSDSAFQAYKVKVVPATSSIDTAGTQIGTANGSTNMSATGSFAANTAIACTVNGTDLATASAGDGTKIVKVFVQDLAGNWSVA